MFSRACEHGIKAVIFIASQSIEGKRVKIGDIVEHTGTPEHFTAKVLGALTRANLINSHKGPVGGFDIETSRMKEIKVIEIVLAVDGDSIFNGCGLGLKECSNEEPCPMHNNFVKVRGELKKMLNNTSIYDLSMGIKSGITTLKR